jgi:hypothetical protein
VKDFVPEVANRQKPLPANPAHTKSQEPANQAAAVRLSRKNETVVSEAAANSTQSKTPLFLEIAVPVIRSAPNGTIIHGPSRNNTSMMPTCTLTEKVASARTAQIALPNKIGRRKAPRTLDFFLMAVAQPRGRNAAALYVTVRKIAAVVNAISPSRFVRRKEAS